MSYDILITLQKYFASRFGETYVNPFSQKRAHVDHKLGDSGNFGANGRTKYAELPEYAKKNF